MSARPGTAPPAAPAGRASAAWARSLGFLASALASAAALLLALRHLGAAQLPGCGFESACERALAGPFGELPGIGWPLAFAGAAFFLGELAAWAVARGGWPAALRWVARLGGLASLALVAIAFQQGTPCPFCLAAQGANLLFVLASERAPRAGRARGPVLAFALACATATAGLALAASRVESRREAADERALAESTSRAGS